MGILTRRSREIKKEYARSLSQVKKRVNSEEGKLTSSEASVSQRVIKSANAPSVREREIVEALRVPKTTKGRRILAKRAGQAHESTKNVLVIKGHSVSRLVFDLLRELKALRNPHSVLLGGRNNTELMHAFESIESLEFLMDKNNAPVFCLGSSTKKHPARLTFGRTFNRTLLDMYEFHVTDITLTDRILLKQYPSVAESKPLLIFQGAGWESISLMKDIQNILIDFFGGLKIDKVRFEGLDRVFVFSCVENFQNADCPWLIMCMQYSITMEKSGSHLPKCNIHPIGPSWNMHLLRSRSPDFDTWKLAIKKPPEDFKPKVKNVSKDEFGATLGRLHVETEPMSKLHTPFGH